MTLVGKPNFKVTLTCRKTEFQGTRYGTIVTETIVTAITGGKLGAAGVVNTIVQTVFQPWNDRNI